MPGGCILFCCLQFCSVPFCFGIVLLFSVKYSLGHLLLSCSFQLLLKSCQEYAFPSTYLAAVSKKCLFTYSNILINILCGIFRMMAAFSLCAGHIWALLISIIILYRISYPRFNVADEEERMRDKETIRKLEDKVHAQVVEMSTLKEQVAEMSTLKEQVAFMMRHMPEFTGLQVRDGCNGSFDQNSPHAHQRSSHASHDIECSNGVSVAVCSVSVMAVCSVSVSVQFVQFLLPLLSIFVLKSWNW
ncbi:hypothetical protein RHMOL_Rhmol08G0100700 [Rhododendron molle]|uniref:Uncharacterized protein n=2 Tax=Rhododendron molle TaxID=49168 RepID=A0ACC0MMG7_RHOML|nr:hypothetical protein RHMOL_Rhmol08G0100700 [Rhododendron molle]